MSPKTACPTGWCAARLHWSAAYFMHVLPLGCKHIIDLVVGAILQEGIEVIVILNALRAGLAVKQ
jgi:cation transport ATPase